MIIAASSRGLWQLKTLPGFHEELTAATALRSMGSYSCRHPLDHTRPHACCTLTLDVCMPLASQPMAGRKSCSIQNQEHGPLRIAGHWWTKQCNKLLNGVMTAQLGVPTKGTGLVPTLPQSLGARPLPFSQHRIARNQHR